MVTKLECWSLFFGAMHYFYSLLTITYIFSVNILKFVKFLFKGNVTKYEKSCQNDICFPSKMPKYCILPSVI